MRLASNRSMTPQAHEAPHRTEVLVVGAGPTGLSLACRLAQRDIDHVIVDQAAQGANTSRAAVIHARTLEALESLGAADALVAGGLAVPRFKCRERNRTLLELDFAELHTKYPYALMLPQNRTEALLEQRLEASGSHVMRPLALTALKQQPDRVTATLASEGAAPQPIDAAYVVGCDGMHSLVREAIDVPFIGWQYQQAFILADVRLDWSLPRDEVDLFLSEHGLLVVAPLPGDQHRVVATVDRADPIPSTEAVRELFALRGPESPPALVRDVVSSARFYVHHRLAEHYRSGRVFLAGDAAHVHSPAGGQGMNAGIQDAIVLADTLADSLRGSLDPKVLDRYEDERKPVARSILKMTGVMTATATLRGQVPRKLRNELLALMGHVPAIRRSFARQLSATAEKTPRRDRLKAIQLLSPSP
jgi:2-polyprenyl-6-methoxyphenol hydroxylase-like FAD-dependent oxidoreductase